MDFQNVSYQVMDAFTAKQTNGKNIKITKGAVISVNFLKENGEITNKIDTGNVHLCENRGRELSLYKHLDHTSLNFNTLVEVYSFGWKQNIKKDYIFAKI